MDAPDNTALFQLSASMLLNFGLIAYVWWCVRRGHIWLGSRWGASCPVRIERAKDPARFKQVLWGFMIFEMLFLPFIAYLTATAFWPGLVPWIK
jgi:hypothetical protein